MNEELVVMGAAAIKQVVRMAKYYQWAYGNIAEADSEIGILGEYIVGSALGCLPRRRSVSGTYDLTTKEGVTIEVKTTSRPQVIVRDKPPMWRWGIKDQNRMLEGREKMADWWIFLKVEFPANATRSKLFNPFDDRWYTVYVISGQALLDSKVKVNVSEATLKRCQAAVCKPSDLPSVIGR